MVKRAKSSPSRRLITANDVRIADERKILDEDVRRAGAMTADQMRASGERAMRRMGRRSVLGLAAAGVVATAETEVDCVLAMEKALREIGQGRTPK